MADGIFNIARGRVNGYVGRVANNDPGTATLVVVALKAAEADAVLEDYGTLALLLAAAGNTESDFGNYARKSLTDADVSDPVPDNTNNWQAADIPNQTWTNAATQTGATVKLIVCYSPTGGADNTIIPLSYHDFVANTNGNDLIAQISADGFARAA